MLVEHIRAHNFTTYKKWVDIKLPNKGLVVVTGSNGSGKSSLVETIAWAGWGKTLRGTQPYTEGVLCEVDVSMGGYQIKRKRTDKGKNGLSWGETGEQPFVFQTPKIASDKLQKQLGPFESWRRTSVFSSQDALTFTTARDSDRKMLLERILGLDMFDTALTRCRVDLKKTTTLLSSLEVQINVKKTETTNLKQQIQTHEIWAKQTAPSETEDELNAEINAATIAEKTATDELAKIKKQKQQLAREVLLAKNDLSTIEQKIKLLGSGVCPSCESTLDDVYMDGLQQTLETTRETLQNVIAQKKDKSPEYDAIETDAGERRINAVSRRTTAKSRLSAVRVAMQRTQQLDGQIQELKTKLSETISTLVGLEEQYDEMHEEMLELQAAEKALGLRGIRAQIISGALAGVEQEANTWLSMLAGDHLNIRLSAHSQTAKKQIIDTISIEVDGAGGGHGYKASSGGERRRIDIAILLALAQIASVSHGLEPGTLWLDEVLDVLDEQGVYASAEVMRRISVDRPVVVITHNPEAIKALQPDMHIHVDKGAVTVR